MSQPERVLSQGHARNKSSAMRRELWTLVPRQPSARRSSPPSPNTDGHPQIGIRK